MNILHINIGYISTNLHQVMIEHLNKFNCNCSVFCATYDEKLCPEFVKTSKNVVVSKCFSKMDRFFFFYKQKKILKKLESNYNVKQYDIIHAYNLFSDGYTAYKLYKKYGIPYVVAVRDTDINAFLKYKPYLLNTAISIMFHSENVFFLSKPYKDFMLAKIRDKKKHENILTKTKIIPNGINDFWFENKVTSNIFIDKINRIRCKTLHIICVARIVRHKNIGMIQKAINLLNKEGWNIDLIVIGQAIDNELLKSLLNDKNTKYHKPVSKENLIDFYRASDLFVLPSKRETFGLVYAEAMTQGLPVIYTKNQGFDKQFEEGLVGYSVDCSSPEDIADKIKLISSNYITIIENLCSNSDKFKWDLICKEYIDLYNRILAKKTCGEER